MLGASLLSVGVSNAAGSSIKACAKKSNGAMRLIDVSKKCKKSERTLTWGTKGAAGAKGAKGASGSSGVSYATYTTNRISHMMDSPAPYTVASLDNLAAGNYLVQATLSVESMFFLDEGQVRCRFYTNYQDGDGVMVSPYSYINFDNSFNSNFEMQGLSITYALEGLSGGNYDKIDFQCYVSGSLDVMVDDFIMSATKVDTLEKQ